MSRKGFRTTKKFVCAIHLKRLTAAAAQRLQAVVVSHAQALVAALDAMPEARRFTLGKRLGETVVKGEEALGWKWPER